ncbi:MAG: hypothetical protein ACJA13_003661 [Paraglaciecola sp.]|jgi:hypothetical protein
MPAKDDKLTDRRPEKEVFAKKIMSMTQSGKPRLCRFCVYKKKPVKKD